MKKTIITIITIFLITLIGVCADAPPESDCSDGIDNNGDGYTDCEDNDCQGEIGPFGFVCGAQPNLIFSVDTGSTVHDISIADFDDNYGKDIAVLSNKAYVYDSSGSQLWVSDEALSGKRLTVYDTEDYQNQMLAVADNNKVRFYTGEFDSNTANDWYNYSLNDDPQDIIIDDLEGDGEYETIVMLDGGDSGDYSVFVFAENGSLVWQSMDGYAPAPYWANKGNTRAGVIDDIDNDGIKDVIVLSYIQGEGKLTILVALNGTDGSSMYSHPPSIGGENSEINAIALGDITGASGNEIITGYKSIQVFSADGSNEEWEYTSAGIHGTQQFIDVTTGNLDDDAYDEVIGITNNVFSIPSTLYVIDNDGSLIFKKEIVGYDESTRDIELLGIADINNDGNNDIIAGGTGINSATNYYVHVWDFDGNLIWYYDLGNSDDIYDIELGDLNDDGIIDVIIASGDYVYAFDMEDDDNPLVVINSPANNTVYNSTTIITVNITVNDQSTTTCDLIVNGSAGDSNIAVTNNLPLLLNASTNSDGYYTWYVECEDEQGNENQTLIYAFTMDGHGPQITVIGPEPATNNTSPTINVTTNEVATCEYKNSTGDYQDMSNTGGTEHSQQLNNLALGEHSYTIRCNDTHGNNNTIEVEFTVSNCEAEHTSRLSVSTTADTIYEINRSTLGMDYELDLVTSTGEDVQIGFAQFQTNPTNCSFGLTELDIYLSINVELSSLDWAIIRVYYNDSGLGDIQESTLRLRYYNETSDSWETYNPPNGGVDTNNNYVWANTTHFSTFGSGGTVQSNNNGGSGGSSSRSCQSLWECTEWTTCNEEGLQTRECTRLNNCDKGNTPALTQSCTYVCKEFWMCDEWSSCIGGKKTRNCTDINSCETESFKPNIEKSCQLVPTKEIIPESEEEEEEEAIAYELARKNNEKQQDNEVKEDLITGHVLGEESSAEVRNNGLGVLIISLIAIVLIGIFGYYYFIKKR